jgi:hypothetical protein
VVAAWGGSLTRLLLVAALSPHHHVGGKPVSGDAVLDEFLLCTLNLGLILRADSLGMLDLEKGALH